MRYTIASAGVYLGAYLWRLYRLCIGIIATMKKSMQTESLRLLQVKVPRDVIRRLSVEAAKADTTRAEVLTSLVLSNFPPVEPAIKLADRKALSR